MVKLVNSLQKSWNILFRSRVWPQILFVSQRRNVGHTHRKDRFLSVKSLGILWLWIKPSAVRWLYQLTGLGSWTNNSYLVQTLCLDFWCHMYMYNLTVVWSVSSTNNPSCVGFVIAPETFMIGVLRTGPVLILSVLTFPSSFTQQLVCTGLDFGIQPNVYSATYRTKSFTLFTCTGLHS